MLIDDGLVSEKPHPTSVIGGVQRIYRWGRFGASVINGKILHCFPFQWEVGTIRYLGDDDKWELTSIPEFDSIEVFQNDDDTNEFLLKIRDYAMSDLRK